MPVYGNLASMPLPDVLQWLGGAGKSGTLEIERNRLRKRILLKNGRVVGCSSDEPSDKLGHFLVSRGRISEQHLREALARQEVSHRHLGGILVEMGALSEDDLLRVLETKAEETIFSLFEWPDAEFRFSDGGVDEGSVPVPIDMRVEDILLKGAQRFDDVQRVREVFDDPGIVLRRTSRTPPPELLRNRMGRRILESINGERTVAEILLHAHGSEFLVTKFLFELHRTGLVEIACVKRIDPPPAAAELPAAPGPVAPAAPSVAAAAAATAVVAPAPPPATASRPDIDADLEVARRLMSRGECDAALEILDAAYQGYPGDDALRRLLAEAEAAFLEKAYRHYLPAGKIVALRRSPQSLTSETLSPAEFFLLSRIDGSWDVKSIIQITPLREVDTLRALKRMREKGIIELRDPS